MFRSFRGIKSNSGNSLIDADTKEKSVWQIVGEPESDVLHGKISVNSPIGRALIGQKKGAIVELIAPTGIKAFQIKKIEWRRCLGKGTARGSLKCK